MRTALGWCIATDGGHSWEIKGFDLDDHVRKLESLIRRAPSDGDERAIFNYYRGTFTTQVAQAFVYDWTSRFGGGHMGAAGTLWIVGTKMVYGNTLSWGDTFISLG